MHRYGRKLTFLVIFVCYHCCSWHCCAFLLALQIRMELTDVAGLSKLTSLVTNADEGMKKMWAIESQETAIAHVKGVLNYGGLIIIDGNDAERGQVTKYEEDVLGPLRKQMLVMKPDVQVGAPPPAGAAAEPLAAAASEPSTAAPPAQPTAAATVQPTASAAVNPSALGALPPAPEVAVGPAAAAAFPPAALGALPPAAAVAAPLSSADADPPAATGAVRPATSTTPHSVAAASRECSTARAVVTAANPTAGMSHEPQPRMGLTTLGVRALRISK